MYTQEQINQIRAKSGLPPLLGKENTSGSTATVGKYDYLLQNKPSTQLDTRAEFMKETAQDVEQTTNAIKGTIAQTQDKISNIAEASISGGENKLTAFLKTAGVIAGGISSGLGDLKGKKGKEIFAPVGRGIFAKAKLDSEEMLVDIGNGNFLSKSIDEAKE